MSKQVNALVKALAKPKPGTPATPPVIMGAVTAVDLSTSPPTLSMQISGDSTATLTGVMFLSSYRPVVGDPVVVFNQNGAYWAHGAMPRSAETLRGNGQVTNIVSGGSNRGNAWPFVFTDAVSVSISGSPGSWTYSSSGRPNAPTFNGCGYFSVTPGGGGGSSVALGFCTVLSSACSISSGVLTLSGYTQDYNGVNIASGTAEINIMAVGW